MAEAARQEKLAAARKKLKKFQEKSTKGDSGNTTPASTVNKKIKLIDDQSLPQRDSKPSTTNSHQQIPAEATERNSVPEPATDFEPDISKHTEEERPSISSSESIRQISLQLNGLMSQTNDFLNGDVEIEASKVTDLEKRNLELAASLEKITQTNQHLTSQIHDLKNHNNKLRQNLHQQQEDIEERHLKEQGALKEQLQVHIQTIGILVAEKTELQSSLTQSQQTAKQKAGEVEELQGRLKASRQRISDIEKDLNSTLNSSQQFEKSSKEFSKEIDRLKIEIYKNNKKMEELQQQNSELTEKLNNKIKQSEITQQELEETRSNLNMAELRVQQLSGSEENKHYLEELSEENIKLEKKVSQLKESLQKLGQERDSIAEQYEQFSKQLNQQVHNLNEHITNLNVEKAALANDKIMLSNRIQSLEDQLDQSNYQSKSIPFVNEEIERLRAMLEFAEEEKGRLQEQHDKDMSDNVTLSRLTEELERKIQELENNLEIKREEEFGRHQLLEEMESDKVATSRALAQNRELKKQLEELQNGFIVMSNNKLELVEKLESEQHVTKELGERLSQQEEELKELREQLLMRDRELNSVQQSNTESTKQMYQQQQLLDRVRHYEAQGQLAELLQQELTKTQERLSLLSSQNSELRTMIARQGEQFVADGKNDEERETTRKDDMVASLSASVNQLEMERDALLRQLGEQQGQREVFRAQLKEMKESKLHHQNGVNGETVSTAEYENMKHVLHQLEERFTKTMREIAELTDQKQQLEHLVTQLQGETETIGEYIALYQVQRSIMKQRALEKDEYIAQLAGDREDLKSKLKTLQDLVMRLLYERQQYNFTGQGDAIRPPGKAVPSLTSNIDLSALNGASTLPDWPDLVDDFDKSNSTFPQSPNGTVLHKDVSTESKEENDTTAKKIMDLISEIGSTSLIEKPTLDNFHPCPVCSGKLMTV